MIAIKATQLREELKNICEKVVSGETVIVSRPNNRNIVMVSEGEYNHMQNAAKEAHNAAYMAKINKSLQQATEGKIIFKTMQELEDMAK